MNLHALVMAHAVNFCGTIANVWCCWAALPCKLYVAVPLMSDLAGYLSEAVSQYLTRFRHA